ncbi:unnamed protein product [Clonostachys chloroleuca]|uniref:Uncharacterized protein n=1 Tax=Clonostachys chloroleuca TaxID=1926264 RepID=A0AA35Q8J7_9HYPO|nr:unnamed protein product [Clonostachys chloroleuca]
MEKFDCVSVGAGYYGLAAAKQYHVLNPDKTLAIFEGESSIGGTWADHRIYPGVKSNNLLGTYEFPEFPMTTERFGVKKDEHIPGSVLNTYLKAYAADFGIDKFMRFNSKIVVAEHQEEGGWILTVADSKAGKEYQVFARRLIMASGLTSEAFLPHFDGEETFGGRIFHGKDFQKNKDTIEKGKTVTVFGGTKFAFDAVYAYASAGVKVHWVIRSSGHGPCWMSPPYVTPFHQWIEALAHTRILTWFSPSIWGSADGYTGIRNFLHGTALGRAIVNGFWFVLGNDVLRLNKYDEHPDTAKLKPWTSAMFTGPSFSIVNWETNFWDLVKSDLVNVYISDIDHLSPGKVHLSDGTELECDSMLAHTGWKHVPAIKFLPEGIEKEIGIPHTPPHGQSDDDLASQTDLLKRADAEILERFPRLKDQPVWNKNYIPLTEQKGVHSDDAVTPCKPLTPYMLYRFIVPPSERFLKTRDLAFAGVVSNFGNPMSAHFQGLWISAYFNGQLDIDPAKAVGDEKLMSELKYQTILHNRFGKWRYPTDWGSNKAPGFIFDAIPYLDLLQGDLGLNKWRKGGWAEIFQAYDPRDYADANDEWKRKHSQKNDGASTSEIL